MGALKPIYTAQSEAQRTSHGLFWYSLHLVFVHRNRLHQIGADVLGRVSRMIEQSAQAKGYLLAEAGVLSDHVHIVTGCPFEESPQEVALGFLNNLAYAHGMKPIYQDGGFVGTVGEYTFRALNSGVSVNRGKPDWGIL